MEERAKETVIIVHGTWAAPKADQFSWYQIPEKPEHEPSFVSKLNTALKKRGSPARCWAHCKDNSEIFTWSGANAWFDRTLASWDLAATINEVQAGGWRCHLVAHSHGGNVAMEALPQLDAVSDSPTGLTGTITTLGTPFINTKSPISQSIGRQNELQLLFMIMVALLWASFIPGIVLALRFWGVEGFSITYISLIAPIILSAVVGACVWGLRRTLFELSSRFHRSKPYQAIFRSLSNVIELIGRVAGIRFKKGDKWDEYWRVLGQATVSHRSMLCVSSPTDEPWQVLHHLRELSNPLAPEFNLFGFVLNNRRDYLEKRYAIERVQGVAFFRDASLPRRIFSGALFIACIVVALFMLGASLYLVGSNTLAAFIVTFLILMVATFFILASIFDHDPSLSGFRWIGKQLRATSRIFNDIGIYVARRRSWSLLQEIAFGLEGYNFELPRAERGPIFAPPTVYKCEDLPTNAERRALAKREKWVTQAFGDVTETLAKMATPDLPALMKTLSTDLSLVHAAYYTDDECIERIADWIAGTTLSNKRKAQSPSRPSAPDLHTTS